jgi:mRNA interferase MazF
MPAINPGEVWMTDFGIAAKVRPALVLTSDPGADELDLVTLLLHTTALRGNRWELNIPKPFLKPGAFHLQQIQSGFHRQAGTSSWSIDGGRNEARAGGA